MEDSETSKLLGKLSASTQESSSADSSQTKFREKREKTLELYQIEQKLHFNEQVLNFRDYVKKRAFIMLYVGMGVLFLLIILQGLGYKHKWFHLSNWVIGAFSAGCLFQTFLIVRSIAINIFPNNTINNKKGDTHVHHHHHK